jgi:hypothetical protein
MDSITIGDIDSFFEWRLNQDKGKKGRRLPGIKTASSLDTFRKQFLGVYRDYTGKDMDRKLMKTTLNVSHNA